MTTPSLAEKYPLSNDQLSSLACPNCSSAQVLQEDVVVDLLGSNALQQLPVGQGDSSHLVQGVYQHSGLRFNTESIRLMTKKITQSR